MDGRNLPRANAWLGFHTAMSVPKGFAIDEPLEQRFKLFASKPAMLKMYLLI